MFLRTSIVPVLLFSRTFRRIDLTCFTRQYPGICDAICRPACVKRIAGPSLNHCSLRAGSWHQIHALQHPQNTKTSRPPGRIPVFVLLERTAGSVPRKRTRMLLLHITNKYCITTCLESVLAHIGSKLNATTHGLAPYKRWQATIRHPLSFTKGVLHLTGLWTFPTVSRFESHALLLEPWRWNSNARSFDFSDVFFWK